METIRDRLATIIREQNINQSKLAEALKISPNSVSLWLSGKTKPSSQSIDQICTKFGYNPDWLTNGEGEPRSLSAADQQIVDTLTHAMKYRTTNTDRFLRVVASASNSPGGDLAIEATIQFLEQLLAEYRAQSPPDT